MENRGVRGEIGIVGFGHQGESWALNLRDSGFEVRTFFRSEQGKAEYARALGFTPEPIENIGAVPILAVLIPDDAMPSFCKAYGKHLQEGQALLFAHGYTLHYKTAEWPTSNDWILLAPKGIGTAVRERFKAGSGVPAVVAVENDHSGNGWQILNNVAEGIGSTRAGLYKGSAKEEVEADLFSEQALLCGGLPALVAETYDLLTKSGVTPEIAYLECVHELKYMADLFAKHGIHETLRRVSPTARFGGLHASRRVISPNVRQELAKILTDIQEGTFAKALSTEAKNGFAKTKEELASLHDRSLEQVGEKVRRRLEERKP